MKQFKSDIMHWKDYDYAVINDQIEKCYRLIIKFIRKVLDIKISLFIIKYLSKNMFGN